ncbi:unnamed protein product [Cylindrotheca closterium]|uniref:Uncharacterized protein n=1 Tax=Cylindrotheca closterium TaxID=2856 RepID=A0AAD2CFQ0_9STRA|nr:unnamed protein product [Cylindrotheca closterium]
MEGYFSRLMREYSATDFVIIRDDAAISESQRSEFSASVASNDEDEAPQRPSFGNSQSVAKNSAPTLPSRKKSIDDLSLTLKRKGGSRMKRMSLNDEMLSHGIRNIGSNELPKLPSGNRGSSSSRHMLFDDIFRDIDAMLKETADILDE